MVKHIAKVFASVLVAWILYSFLGVIPAVMQFPLPDRMHLGNGAMQFTGHNSAPINTREIEEKLDSRVIGAGSFEKLALFDNGNLAEYGWYNPEQEFIFFYIDPSSRTDVAQGISVADPEITGTATVNKGSLTVAYGKHEYLLQNDVRGPAVGDPLGGMVVVDDWMAEVGDGTSLDYQKIGQLLETQHSRKITPRQMLALVQISADGTLLYWDPEAHLALFRLGERELAQLNTQTGEIRNFGAFPYQHTVAISAGRILAYSPIDRQVLLHDLISNRTQAVFDCPGGVEHLNFCYWEGGLLLFCVTGDDIMMVYRDGDPKSWTFQLGEGYQADVLLVGPESVLTLALKDGLAQEYLQYKRVQFRNLFES